MNRVVIGGEEYFFSKNIRENKEYRESFFELSNESFEIDFKEWYRLGYWTDKYIPYSLIKDDRVVSNVSVNKIKLEYLAKEYLFIQIGTVMTDECFRNKGLADYLMKRVLADWKDRADNIYLYANDSVLDFYPKYNLEESSEYSFTKAISKIDGKVEKLDMDKEENIDLVFNLYKKSNPYSKINMLDNFGLIMFYCTSFLKERVYYIEELGVIGILEYMDRKMICYDIFGEERANLDEVVGRLAEVDTEKVELGFTPLNIEGFEKEVSKEEDLQLFVLNESIFKDKITLPYMSRA